MKTPKVEKNSTLFPKLINNATEQNTPGIMD